MSNDLLRFPLGFIPMKGDSISNESDIKKLRYPLLVSPKIDGIRCLKMGGTLYSYNLKPIPNKRVQEKFKGLPNGLDGELYSLSGFNETQSQAMKADGYEQISFAVFDRWDMPNSTYRDRIKSVLDIGAYNQYVDVVVQKEVMSSEHLLDWHSTFLHEGYEGSMVRDPESLYKYGRSTLKEQRLLKMKPVADSEAIVVCFEAAMENNNEEEKDNHGRTKRSSKKEGKVQKEIVGKIIAKVINGPFTGKIITVATGTLTKVEREMIWRWHQLGWQDRAFTFQYQMEGFKELPRFPRFYRWREDV